MFGTISLKNFILSLRDLAILVLLTSIAVLGTSGCNSQSTSDTDSVSDSNGLHINSDYTIQTDSEHLFNVVSLEADYDDGTVQFDESNDGYLSYTTPMVRFRASVKCPKTSGEDWKIGFVQFITMHKIKYSYLDENYTEWKINTPISDCIGSEYPWYDGSDGYAKAEGTANLYCDDNFNVKMGWRQPLPDNFSEERENEELSKIERAQNFVVFLTAVNSAENKYIIIKQIDWSYSFAAQVNCSNPRGERTALQVEQKPEPIIRNDFDMKYFDIKLMQAPNANESQVLVSHVF